MKYNNQVITLSMGGRISMLNERINCMINKKIYKKHISVVVIMILVITFSLLFVSITKKDTKAVNANSVVQTKDENVVDNNTVVEESINTNNTYNNYYNPIKTDGIYIYYSTKDGLIRRNINTTEKKIIENGYCILGDIFDGYLYYTKYEDNVILSRISLDTLEKEYLCKFDNDSQWGFSAPCINEDGEIIIEENIGEIRKLYYCSYNADKRTWESKADNHLMDKIDSITNGDISKLRIDTVNTLSTKKIFFLENENNQLEIYSSNAELLNTINDYMGNVMLVDNSIVYYDTDNNIHLCLLDSYDDKIIYNYNNNIFLNYGAYDENGIYGFYNKAPNEYLIVQLLWDGRIIELYKVSSDNDISMLSSFNDHLLFFDKNELVNIDVKK